VSSISEIATQIGVILGALADIDEVSLDNYDPPVKTRSVALVLPPFGLRGRVGAIVGLKTRLVHRIPCELWVKMDTGDLDAVMQRGRDICLEAACELQATAEIGSALNGTVTLLGDDTGAAPFEWQVDENPIRVGNVAYIRATLFVTVTEDVDLTP
jgi:hypothetical protein